jgi:hypothetical protein
MGNPIRFSVVDTAKYDIEVYDYDATEENWNDPNGSPTTVSMRRYLLAFDLEFADEDSISDILWLRAHDYGARVIVSPNSGLSTKYMMRMRRTAFGDSVWNVTVPRDEDDPSAFRGTNNGDMMADYWEEGVLGAVSGSQSIIDFAPFYQMDGQLLYADRDKNPTGRDIKGDGFCNWEEYRGFTTTGDQDGYYPPSAPEEHTRLNPSTKNVMVHFMPNA